MNSITPRYYRPYDSGDDSGDDSVNDSANDSANDSDSDTPNVDPRYSIIKDAGPNLSISAKQLKYMEHAPGLAAAEYDATTNITSLSSFTYLNPPKTTRTTLISVKSINRNIKSYPSPFNFQIKTPRIYKDVIKFQLVQLSFPNNTTAFIDSKFFQNQLIEALLKAGINP